MMKQKLSLLILSVCIAGSICGQNLKVFTVNMKADSLCYLSLKNNKAYTSATVAAVKDEVDLGLFRTLADKNDVLEWYNLRKDNDKVPAHLTGTNTGVVAISFDRDQFDKCKTIADLSRMTGYMTRNSFSHFAVIRNSSSSYQRCFIAETAEKKRALIYVTINPGNSITTEVKTE
jgi:hypothetical protein